jgi:hypothetical protein
VSGVAASLAARRQAVLRGWVVLAVAVALALGLLAGLIYAVAIAIGGSSKADHAPGRPAASAPVTAATPGISSAGTALAQTEDALASKPMLWLPPSAAQPQPLVSATAGPAIRLPKATVHDQLVPTGFPRTSAGAVAQLAAIDALAWRDASPTQVQEVYTWASLPGAVSLKDWTPYVGVVSLLDNAGIPNGATTLQTTFTPTHAQIKGVLADGDFVVACVLGEFDGTYRTSTKVGVGDCQRMVWSDGRWRIGPGSQPAYAPSAWPGSADCVRAGWRVIADA